ncbi:MAG: hypothetical protein A3D52_01465 [Candidatus Taylorbacteria bacterium RIFCSPHIGHO2_02_FULL_44_36]|nr:MAG: hypothetical protein A3D52_01465 [Candidatus Taylorbacteria bacterium RIFCSPHIGHO2_02_FULL_44_36]
MLPGLFFAFIPMLPSLGYMISLVLVYSLFFNSQNFLSGRELLVLAIVALVAFLTDYLSGALGAYFSGASKKSIVAGVAGLAIGLILFPPLGGFFGLFLAVFASEFYLNRDRQRALKAATGSVIGTTIGVAINIAIGLSFVVLFTLFALS